MLQRKQERAAAAAATAAILAFILRQARTQPPTHPSATG